MPLSPRFLSLLLPYLRLKTRHFQFRSVQLPADCLCYLHCNCSITRLEVVEAVETNLNPIVTIIVEPITEIVSTLKGVVSALESSKWAEIFAHGLPPLETTN
jgi:hypothetical protein